LIKDREWLITSVVNLMVTVGLCALFDVRLWRLSFRQIYVVWSKL
jgi:hypothetical protein